MLKREYGVDFDVSKIITEMEKVLSEFKLNLLLLFFVNSQNLY